MQTDENMDLDSLLSDCKELLGEKQTKAPETSAEDIHIDYKQFYGEDIPQLDLPQAVRPLTAYEQSKPAYQSAKRSANEKQKKEQEKAEQMPPSADSTQYANWLYEQGTDPETVEQRRAAQELAEQTQERKAVKKTKRRKTLLWILAVLAAITALFGTVMRQPVAPASDKERLARTSTVLLAGTDEGGLRTDTMILMQISGEKRSINLVSIPRDTLVLGNYSVPKINSAYGYGGGADGGMEELMKRVTETVGFRPDGYILIHLDGFERLVDVMGGVRYDVPMPMQYSDPSQGLEINLSAGMQKLDGKQAMQLVRFRSGYAAADLERVNVQRKFLQQAFKQWTSPLRWVRYPAALGVLLQSAESDLSLGNYLWLCKTAIGCTKNTELQTLPGAPAMIGGGSYYVLDEGGVLDTVNTLLNPYLEPINASDITVRNG